MKRIDKTRAIELINMGIYPKCETSREILVPVRSIDELNRLELLSTSQSFILYGYENEAISSFKIPDNAIELTIDEASPWLAETGNYVFIKVIGQEEEKMNFKQFVNFLRTVSKNGDSFLLYYYE